MKLKRVLFVPDTHAPFHDRLAFSLMLDVANAFFKGPGSKEVVFLGDFFDFYSVSRHDKDPLMDFKTWKDEMKDARECFDLILDHTIGVKKYTFLEGNHEKRLQAYISNHAPKLSGIYQTRELLCIPEDWTYLPYGQKGHYKIGNLVACHGSRAGENATANMVKKFRANVIHGHTHKLQEHHINSILGDDWVGIGAGWLGDQRKAAEYIQDVSDWSLGFVLAWFRDNGSFYYQLVHVKSTKTEYSCLFQNEVYVR